MFLSIFRPLNSLQISKRLRLLDSLKVSKHFTRPLSSLFPSPGLRHVAYARPLEASAPPKSRPGSRLMLLMRVWGLGLDPLMMRALWGPPWRREKPRRKKKKKPFTGGTRGSAALASGPLLRTTRIYRSLGTSRCPKGLRPWAGSAGRSAALASGPILLRRRPASKAIPGTTQLKKMLGPCRPPCPPVPPTIEDRPAAIFYMGWGPRAHGPAGTARAKKPKHTLSP